MVGVALTLWLGAAESEGGCLRDPGAGSDAIFCERENTREEAHG